MVNLMKQTLTINVAQTAADTIASQIETIVHGHEPDVEVSEIVQEMCIRDRNAKKEIILSTFAFQSDESGKLILGALHDAADRGVHIRLLVRCV